MTRFMKDLKPDNFEDIIAGISLFRPGPMEHIPRYVEARHDASKIKYDHPLLEPILDVTYGCMVYQEQVMQIVRDLAGFSLGQSDNVRRAMSKKQPEVIAGYKDLFINGGIDEGGRQVPGACANGVPRQVAAKIFEDVMAFAGYAFNKAHAAAYAVVAYNTAWLKYYYPVEFMAAMLNSWLGSLDQAAQYVRAAKDLGIEILPPDINKSYARFTTEDGGIRFALGGVKNVGQAAINKIVTERENNGEFTGYGDFMRRICECDINRRMIESLIKASALDGFGVPRAKMIAVLEPFANQLQNQKKMSSLGQISIFQRPGMEEQQPDDEPVYPDVSEFDVDMLLAMEKEMLGLYITGHPLDAYREDLSAYQTVTAQDMVTFDEPPEGSEAPVMRPELPDQTAVIVGGQVIRRRNQYTKRNDLMAFLEMEDLTGSFELIVFPAVYEKYVDLLGEGKAILVRGRLSVREDEAIKVIAEELFDLANLPKAARVELASFGRGRTAAGYSPASNSAAQDSSVVQDSPADSSAVWAKMPDPGEAPSTQNTLVVRWRGETSEEALKPLKSALAYFPGSSRVRVYLEQESRLLEPLPRGVQLDSETLALLAERFGVENISVF